MLVDIRLEQEAAILNMLEELKRMAPGSPEAMKQVTMINSMIKAVNEDEKENCNAEIERAKLEQEKKRAEQAAKDEKREFWLGVAKIAFEAGRIALLIFAIKKGMGTVMAFEQTGIARSSGWKYVDRLVNMAVK